MRLASPPSLLCNSPGMLQSCNIGSCDQTDNRGSILSALNLEKGLTSETHAHSMQVRPLRKRVVRDTRARGCKCYMHCIQQDFLASPVTSIAGLAKAAGISGTGTHGDSDVRWPGLRSALLAVKQRFAGPRCVLAWSAILRTRRCDKRCKSGSCRCPMSHGSCRAAADPTW